MKRPWMLPLVPLYAAGLSLRELRLDRGWEPVRRLRRPVISIGNLSTGGSGKTPLTITLARLLSARGFQVDVLSRGYGRTSRKAVCVQRNGAPEQYGDEPLLIAREAGVPVYVAAARYDAGVLAEADSSGDHGAQRVHILDDGFQHRQLHRDVDILLLQNADLHDSLLPSGNLREPLGKINRATVLAYASNEPEVGEFLTRPPNDGDGQAPRWCGPVWRLRRSMEIPELSGSVVAFCGIARPDQFFAGLEAGGVRLVSRIPFADHHPYTSSDIESLIANARSKGASAFITTEKDQVRLTSLASRFPSGLPLKVARLTLSFEDELQVFEWLSGRLRANQAHQSV